MAMRKFAKLKNELDQIRKSKNQGLVDEIAITLEDTDALMAEDVLVLDYLAHRVFCELFSLNDSHFSRHSEDLELKCDGLSNLVNFTAFRRNSIYL